MSMIKKETSKSVIYEFDGFSAGYNAYVAGGLAGKFIVPKNHAHLVQDGNELETLRDMHSSKKYGAALQGARVIK